MKLLGSGGGVGADIVRQHPAAAGGAGAGHVDVVLDDDGHARQRQGFAGLHAALHGGGLFLGVLVQADQGVEATHGLGAGQGALQELLGGGLTALYGAGELGGGLKSGHIAGQSSGVKHRQTGADGQVRHADAESVF